MSGRVGAHRSRGGAGAVVLAALAVLLSGAGADAAVRHAAPGATGPLPCAAASPCSVQNAATGADVVAGDEIRLAAGSYALSSTLVTGTAVTIQGPPPGSGGRATLVASDQTALMAFAAGTVLRDVTFEALGTGGAFALNLQARAVTLERVRALGHGTNGGMLVKDGATVRDSLGWSRDGNGVALGTTAGGTGPIELVNVTAVGGNAGLLATQSFVVAGGRLDVRLTNSIAHGREGTTRGGADLVTDAGTAGVVRVRAVRSSVELASRRNVAVYDTAEMVAGAPLLADTLTGDLRQLPGSPTLDAGTSTPAAGLGPRDVDGEPRLLGSGVDVGADERGVAPLAATGAASDVGPDRATVAGSADALGAEAATMLVEYGTTPALGQASAAQPAGASATIALTGLAPQTTYHARVVANSPYGTTAGATVTFTTASAPPPGPAPRDPEPPGRGPAPPPVRGAAPPPAAEEADRRAPLLSRLALTGRRVTVRVSEPATVRARLASCTRRRVRTANGAARSRTVCRTVARMLMRARRAGVVRLTIPKAVRGGAYRLALSAVDAAGNRAAPLTRRVTVRPTPRRPPRR